MKTRAVIGKDELLWFRQHLMKQGVLAKYEFFCIRKVGIVSVKIKNSSGLYSIIVYFLNLVAARLISTSRGTPPLPVG